MSRLFVRNLNVDEFICSLKSSACELPPTLVVTDYTRDSRILQRSVPYDVPIVCASDVDISRYKSFLDYLVGRQKVACCIVGNFPCWIFGDKDTNSLRLLADFPFVTSPDVPQICTTAAQAESKENSQVVSSSDEFALTMASSSHEIESFRNRMVSRINSFLESSQQVPSQSDACIRLPIMPSSSRYVIHELIDQQYESVLCSLSESETDDDLDEVEAMKRDPDKRHIVICHCKSDKRNQYMRDNLDEGEVKVVSLSDAALAKDRKKRKIQQKTQEIENIKKSRII